MKLKFVVFDEAYPVLFGEYLKHSDVHAKYHRPTSAGFVYLKEVETPEGSPFCTTTMTKASCYGESISLNLKPAAGDEFLIERMLNN